MPADVEHNSEEYSMAGIPWLLEKQHWLALIEAERTDSLQPRRKMDPGACNCMLRVQEDRRKSLLYLV